MKVLTTIICTIAFIVNIQAQSPYNESLFYKDVTAKYITTEGVLGEIETIYHPGLLKSTKLGLGTIGSEGISKDQLQAIYVAGEIWMPTSTPSGMQWALTNEQGAINYITYITSETKDADIVEEKMSRSLVDKYQAKDIQLITGNLYQKRGGKTYTNSDLILGFKKKMSAMTADYEALSEKIKNKEKDYRMLNVTKIISEYNEWYEAQHPNEIKVFTPESFGATVVKKKPANLKEGIAQMNAQKEKAAEKKAAMKASRPTEPSAEIASSKPNQPERRESFPDKVKRIEADGNKIGVLFRNPYNYVKPYQISSFGADAGLRDTIPAYKLDGLGEKLISKLNAHFGTTIFEMVDLNQIPYREVQFLGARLVDDWWSTKYKVLLYYTVDSYYQFVIDENKQTEGEYRANAYIWGEEFKMDDEKPKKDILFRNFNMGNYYFQLGEIDGKLEAETLSEATKQYENAVDPDLIYEELEAGYEKRNKKLLKRKLK